ncbi:hypothetical protein TRICI_003962 [Trichomonascus ciferrii]|uniref:beta-glucosidase n=1 Tax=Trichomonascus ciferrii TaxID=44093 RepID=A0A642V1S5_9ASCO|nr:hypothetical protein TRICI_003962 [Trichomonascus ciferrii]
MAILSYYLILLLASVYVLCANTVPNYPSPQGGRSTSPVDDDWNVAYEKAKAFVSDMTLIEKLNLTSGVGFKGMGRCTGNTRDIPSKGFYGLCLQDEPTGVRGTDFVTVFPAALSAGANFNRQIIYDRAKAMGLEFRNKGVDVFLGPAVGPLGTKELGGRNWEAFGTDPYLQGIAGAETVKGIQDAGMIAVGKHFILNEQGTKRTQVDELVDERSLYELYVWPFADLIREGVSSIMPSYNLVNGTYSTENGYLLNRILKNNLGFLGFTVSDWWATHSTRAALGGLDMDMPGNIVDLNHVYNGGDFPLFEDKSYFGANLTLGVLSGSIPIERIDDMATRIMAAYFKTKLDEIRPQRGPPTFSEFSEADTGYLYLPVGKGPVVSLNEHVDVRTQYSEDASYNVAIEAITLLKNEKNTLPLNDKKKVSRISVLGRAAFPNPYDQCLGDGNKGCSLEMQQGAAMMGGGSGTAQSTSFITPFEAVNERVRRDKTSMRYFKGSNSSDPMFISTATHSDVNLIFAQSFISENQDLENDTLWYDADQVIEGACRVNKNNVVVITAPGPLNLEKWIENENVTAVLYTPYLGQVAGKAIVDVLYGERDVSGRLPFTIAMGKQDIVPITNVTHPDPTIPREALDDALLNAGLYVDYRYFDHKNVTPRYEFGFGMSYTKFNFSDIKVHTVKVLSEQLPPPPG